MGAILPDRAMCSPAPVETMPTMPLEFFDLPPDHPIFSSGPMFEFRSELPEAGDDPPEADVTPSGDVEEDG